MAAVQGHRQQVAIVQARMGSTRLPGKVMRTLGNRTVLEHVLARCSAIPGIDGVWCAVSDAADSDPVADAAGRAGFPVVRGPEADVLGRYRDTARAASAGVVLRVTSDCPLIDPEVCGAVLQLRADHQADYASNNLVRSWPHGLDCEAFRVEWLERAACEARAAEEREHVTPFIRIHAQARRINLDGPGGQAARERWTLDTPQDWTYIEAIFRELPPGRAGWSWKVVMRLLERTPELRELAPSAV
jgi:spore coat polysaccharide biosynthesis protein SpsF (cytidylyltransferase family)